MKSDHTKKFPAHDFYRLVFIPTSRTNNKRVISTFMFGYPHLTLKEGSKVKSDHINRFPVHDFLQVGYNDLLNSENLKEAIAQLCHDIEVCNFTML